MRRCRFSLKNLYNIKPFVLCFNNILLINIIDTYYTMDVLHQRLHLLLKDKIPYDHLPFGCYPYSMFIQDHRHTNIPIFLYKWISHLLNNCSHYISFRFTIILHCLHELSDLRSEIYSQRLPLNILIVPISRTYFQIWNYYAYNHFETQPFELLACLIA